MTFRNWIVIIGILCGFTSANFLLMALVVGRVTEELEKVKCRIDVTRSLVLNMQMNWTNPMLTLAHLSGFIQQFIGRLEEESGVHSKIPIVFDPQPSKDYLFGPNPQVEIEALEELYGDGPEDVSNG